MTEKETESGVGRRCGYRAGTWECRGDGYLWDADTDGWIEGEMDHPCPECNTALYLEGAKDDAESTSYISNNYTMMCVPKGYMTGADMWDQAVKEALHCNATAAEAALSAIGTVRALTEDDGEQVYHYLTSPKGETPPPSASTTPAPPPISQDTSAPLRALNTPTET
jgi:hypothetical protein